MYVLEEYEIDYHKHENIHNETEDICLICWMPSETNNNIKYLSEHQYIYKICDCNPKFHSNCLQEWIKTKASCPICRKHLIIEIATDNDETINIFYIYCYVNCLKYAVNIFKFCCYLMFFNMFYFYVFNFYVFYEET
jgi:hypothetical protein